LLFSVIAVHSEEPVHVHLAYGALDNQMQITFASSSSCDATSTFVLYGTTASSLNGKVPTIQTHFDEGNMLGHKYVYNALLSNLTSGQVYYYACVCGGDKSAVFHFNAKLTGTNWVPNLLVFGDMGRTLGPQALPGLLAEVEKGWPTAAVHIGDFAYDMDTLEGYNGDIFMSQIQDIAAYIPYMVAVGNHEAGHNFSHYVNRFKMPNTPDNMWFSWNIANAHFIAYSTEVYYERALWDPAKQFAWLEQDLILANQQRNIRPWIIAYGHRPMYCSNDDGDECTKNTSLVRIDLEPLFNKYGVDLILEAHEHSYERMWPVYNGVVTQFDYNNPKAPVHIITGCAGCNEDLGVCVNGISGPKGPWSAFRASGKNVYGYARMQILNNTHIYWEERSTPDHDVLDSAWIVQNNHGPF